MKPMEELLGKTIAEITVEELEAEIAERRAVVKELPKHCLDLPKHLRHEAADHKQMERKIQLTNEQIALRDEISRITLQPVALPYPAGIGVLDYSAFWKGIEYGRTLDKFQSANKGHVDKRTSKLFAIKQAGKLTRNYSGIRYADLRRQIAATLVTMGRYCPSDKKIKEWLNDAVKEGLLYLPEEMPKGRGPKK